MKVAKIQFSDFGFIVFFLIAIYCIFYWFFFTDLKGNYKQISVHVARVYLLADMANEKVYKQEIIT